MRIAYLSVFHPFRGGIAQFNGHIFKQLSAQHQVRAFNFSLQYPNILFPGKSQYVSAKDTQVREIPSKRLLNSINPLSYLSTAAAIRRFQPDLLINRFWMPFFGPALGTVNYLVKRKNCKVISIIDNLIPHEQRFFDRSFTRYFLGSTDICLSMSHSVTEEIRGLSPKMPVVHHPHPVYDHFGTAKSKQTARKILGIPDNKKTLLFFGLIRKYKGLDLILRAMDYLSEDFYLIVAGEPYENFAPYQKIISESSAKMRIKTFTKYIPTEDVSTFFSAADAGVLPYKTATQSGVAAMAFHFNLPVVVTNTGGLKQMIEPHNIGLITPEITPKSIAQTISKLFEKPQEAQKISENIRKFKSICNWKTFSDTLINAYENTPKTQK